MIPLYSGAEAEQWLERGPAVAGQTGVEDRVSDILSQVRSRGDEALSDLAERFGDPPPRLISPAEQVELSSSLSEELQQVLQRSADNIRHFAEAMVAAIQPVRLDNAEFSAGVDMRPVERVACYAPGGRHPLPSTVLMTGLAARAAGVGSVHLICPSPHPAVMFAARLIRADRVYQMGGAQAVAAVAYGTNRVECVDMVVGPGNAYVTEAKRQLQGRIGIDMLAGPSEVTILADPGANPKWLALDLLAQAEHDPDARVVLLTWDAGLAAAVQARLSELARSPDYPSFLKDSLKESALLVLAEQEACVAAANRLAPEHLQLAVSDPGPMKDKLRHYGGLFLGYATTVPFGDYGAGPNHTLPTAGTARFSAGLSPLTFLRPQCWLQAHEPHRLAQDTGLFAEQEGLLGHAAAARARL